MTAVLLDHIYSLLDKNILLGTGEKQVYIYISGNVQMPIQKNTGALKRTLICHHSRVCYCHAMYLQMYTYTNRHAVGNSGRSLNI